MITTKKGDHGFMSTTVLPGAMPAVLNPQDLMHSVETGTPAANKVVGMPVFEYFMRNRDLSETFNDAMTSFSAMVIPAALRSTIFQGFGRWWTSRGDTVTC
jgi:hypothetical protein